MPSWIRIRIRIWPSFPCWGWRNGFLLQDGGGRGEKEHDGGPRHQGRGPPRHGTGMEVTEIYNFGGNLWFCQLSSHSWGLFTRAQVFKTIGPSLLISLAQRTPSFDTNMLPKVVFNIKVFVKFKISNNSKQNMDETDSKQPKIHRKILTSLWILKISRANQKSLDFCQIFGISNKKSLASAWI